MIEATKATWYINLFFSLIDEIIIVRDSKTRKTMI